jgi:hypothetical protein
MNASVPIIGFVAIIVGAVLYATLPPRYQPYVDYCSDTPEGKAIIRIMNNRFDDRKIRDNEEAMQSMVQKINGVRIWAAENTMGTEQKAWLCWSDYFLKIHSEQLRLLHARNTIKNPPE